MLPSIALNRVSLFYDINHIMLPSIALNRVSLFYDINHIMLRNNSLRVNQVVLPRTRFIYTQSNGLNGGNGEPGFSNGGSGSKSGKDNKETYDRYFLAAAKSSLTTVFTLFTKRGIMEAGAYCYHGIVHGKRLSIGDYVEIQKVGIRSVIKERKLTIVISIRGITPNHYFQMAV